jgi:hypothetical protein
MEDGKIQQRAWRREHGATTMVPKPSHQILPALLSRLTLNVVRAEKAVKDDGTL